MFFSDWICVIIWNICFWTVISSMYWKLRKGNYFYCNQTSAVLSTYAQLFEGRLGLNPKLNLTWVSFSFVQKHFLGQFSLIFIGHRINNLLTKRTKLNLLYNLSYLNSNFALILGYLNPALNNPAMIRITNIFFFHLWERWSVQLKAICEFRAKFLMALIYLFSYHKSNSFSAPACSIICVTSTTRATHTVGTHFPESLQYFFIFFK